MSLEDISDGAGNSSKEGIDYTTVTTRVKEYDKAVRKLIGAFKGLDKIMKTVNKRINTLEDSLGKAKSAFSTLDLGASQINSVLSLTSISISKTSKSIGTLGDDFAIGVDKMSEALDVHAERIEEATKQDDDFTSSLGDLIDAGTTAAKSMLDNAEAFGVIAFESADAREAFNGIVDGIGAMAGAFTLLASNPALAALTFIIGLIQAISAAVKYFKEKSLKNAIDHETKFLQVSEDVMKKITELSKKKKDEHAATSIYMDKIIKDAQITKDNFLHFGIKTKEIINDLKKGSNDMHETTISFGKSFEALVEKTRLIGEEGNTVMVDLILTAREKLPKIAELQKYVNEQLNEGVKALEEYTSTFNTQKIKTEMEAINKELKDQNTSIDKSIELNEKFNKKQKELESATDSLTDSWSFMQVATQETFYALIAEGKSFVETVNLMGGHLDNLSSIAKDNKLHISSGIKEMTDLRDFIVQHETLTKRIEATNKWVGAMNNSAYMSKAIFKAFTQEVESQFQALDRAGKRGTMAYQLMGPQLQKINDYAIRYGYTLDENTKKRLAVAKASKIIKSTEIQVLTQIRDAIIAMSHAMLEFQKSTMSVKDGLEKLKDSDLMINFGLDPDKIPEMLEAVKQEMEKNRIGTDPYHLYGPDDDKLSLKDLYYGHAILSEKVKFRLANKDAAKFLTDYKESFFEFKGILERGTKIPMDLRDFDRSLKMATDHWEDFQITVKQKLDIDLSEEDSKAALKRLILAYNVIATNMKKVPHLNVNTSNAEKALNKIPPEMKKVKSAAVMKVSLKTEDARESVGFLTGLMDALKEELSDFAMNVNTSQATDKVVGFAKFISPALLGLGSLALDVTDTEARDSLSSFHNFIEPLFSFIMKVDDEQAKDTAKAVPAYLESVNEGLNVKMIVKDKDARETIANIPSLMRPLLKFFMGIPMTVDDNQAKNTIEALPVYFNPFKEHLKFEIDVNDTQVKNTAEAFPVYFNPLKEHLKFEMGINDTNGRKTIFNISNLIKPLQSFITDIPMSIDDTLAQGTINKLPDFFASINEYFNLTLNVDVEQAKKGIGRFMLNIAKPTEKKFATGFKLTLNTEDAKKNVLGVADSYDKVAKAQNKVKGNSTELTAAQIKWNKEVKSLTENYKLTIDLHDPTGGLDRKSKQILQVLKSHKGAFDNNAVGAQKLKQMIKDQLDLYDKYDVRILPKLDEQAKKLNVVSSAQEQANLNAQNLMSSYGFFDDTALKALNMGSSTLIEKIREMTDGKRLNKEETESLITILEAEVAKYKSMENVPTELKGFLAFWKYKKNLIKDAGDQLIVTTKEAEEYSKKMGAISKEDVEKEIATFTAALKINEKQLINNPAMVEKYIQALKQLRLDSKTTGAQLPKDLDKTTEAVTKLAKENTLLTKYFGLTNEKIRELTPEARGLGIEFAKTKEAEEKLNQENKLLSTYLGMSKESIKNLDPVARKAKLGLAQMKEAAKSLKDENKLLTKYMGMTEKSIKELDPAARKSAVALAKERSEMEKVGKETDKNAKKTNKLTEGLTALATQFGASEKDVATFLSTSSNAGEKMVAFLNITDAVIGKLGEMGIISKSSTAEIKNMVAGFKSIGSGVNDIIKSGGNPLSILSGGLKIVTGFLKLMKNEFDWVSLGKAQMRQFGGATEEMGKKLGETAKELKSMKKAFAQLAAEMIGNAKMLDLKDFSTWSKELGTMTHELANEMNKYNQTMDEYAKKKEELRQKIIQEAAEPGASSSEDRYKNAMEEQRLKKQLVEAEKTRRETAEMAEQMDTAFASLVEKADLLGTHGEKSMVKIIDKARELRDMGIDSPEIFKYVEEQIETGLTGLEEYLQRATEKVTEIKELETGMEDQSGEELQKSIQEIADLKASLADITTPEGFNRALEYAAGYMHALQKDGKSMIEIVNQMGPQLDTLITLGESGPYETEMLSELLSLREFVSANEEVMTSIGASQKMLESFGNTGTLTSDLLKASTRDAVAYYDTLIAKGADEKQALEALAPLLAKQAWYAEQGGFVTEDIFDSDTLALLDKAREQGINMDIFLPTGEKMVDLLQQIKDILAGEDSPAPGVGPNLNLLNPNVNVPDQESNKGEGGGNATMEDLEQYWTLIGINRGHTGQAGQEADEALNDAGTGVNELSNKIGELDHQLNNTMGNLDNTGAAANSAFGDAGNAVQGFGDTVEQVDSQLNNQLAESFNNTDLSAQTTFGNADAAVQSLGDTVGQVENQLNEALVYSIETAGSSAQLNFANASAATNTWADSITAVGGQVETTLPAQLEYMAEMGIGTFETVNQSSLTVSGTLDTIHGQLGIQLIESLGSLEDNTEEAMNSITKKTGEWANSLGGVEDQLAKDLPGAVGELDEIYADKMTGHSIVTETHKWKYSLQEINDILGKELPATTEELDKKYAHVTGDINKYLEVTSKEGYKSRMTLEEMVAEYEKVYKAYSTVATWEQTEEARNQAADYERQMENLKDAIEETMPSLDNWSEKFNTFKEELSGSIGVDRNMINIARGIRESGQTLKEIDAMIDQSLSSGASGMAAWLKALGPEQETIDELKKLQSEYDTLNEKKEKTDDEMQKMIDLQAEIAEGTTTAHQEFMKDEAALMDSQNLMVAYFHSLKAEGKNVSEIMSIMGTGFQALVDKSMEDFDGGAGFGMTKAFEDLYNLQTKISNNQTLVQGIEGLSEAIHGMGDSMLYMSQETFGDFEGSAIRAFEKLREANFTNTQSLQMVAPLLQDLASYADEYGLSMDSATAELYDQARAQGLIQEAQKSDTEQLVEINLELTSVMKDMVNIFGTIGNSDAFDSVTKKAKLAGEAVAAINGPDIDTVTGYKIQGNKVADLVNEHIQLGQTVSGLKNELQMIDQMDPFTIMIDRVRALKDEFIQMYETLAFVARSATINDLGEKVPISVEARRYSESHGVTPRERIAALGNIHPYDTYDVPGRPGVQAKPTTVSNNFSITIENNSEDTPRTIIDKFIVGYKRNEKDVQGVIKNEL